MKKIVLTLFILLTAGTFVSQAQQQQQPQPLQQPQENPLMQVLPNDAAVRVGVMPNGIKYYIRHNDRDPQRANFHIFYKVGAVQEEDHQNGLAHFLEHMAFNGSKNFPDNQLTSYLESIGVRFGENVNAQTGQESTTYMLTNVPVVREGILDSALLILHDWAGFISLNDDDIDAERGVIREELRERRTAQKRIQEAQSPAIYNNSIYARRNVIGNDSLLQSFKYQDIKDFYHHWYRPELQAFVIVGDVDVDQVERKLLAMMADIAPSAPELAAYVQATPVIELNATPMVAIATDAEVSSTAVQLYFRHNPLPDSLNNRMLYDYIRTINELTGVMFNERLMNIARDVDAPFLNAGGGYTPWLNAADLFFVGATAHQGQSLRAITALYTEALRMQRSGFTQSELDRAKAVVIRDVESAFADRDNRRNLELANAYMGNFEHNTPYMTPEAKRSLRLGLLQTIDVIQVNRVAASYIRDAGSAVLVSSPEKEGVVVPAEAEVLAAVDAVKASQIAPYTENVITEPLIGTTLKGSKVAKSEQGAFQSTVLTLKNGVKVVLKPTKFEGDRLSMEAFQAGGTSTIADLADLYSINLLDQYEGMAGVSKFSATDLARMLAGKQAEVICSVDELTQGFKGAASTKDLETLLQLTYLKYTDPRFSTSDWDILMNQYRDFVPNLKFNPQYIYTDSLTSTMYGHDPRMAITSERTMAMVSLDRLETTYRRLYSNANGMTFVFVGDFDPQLVQPLLEKYIGSLPSSRTAPSYGALVPSVVSGAHDNYFNIALQTPKVVATQLNSGAFDYTLENRMAANAVAYILNIRYQKAIREEKGGTYGVNVKISLDKLPTPFFELRVNFETDASKIDELMPIVTKEINDMVANGVSAENLIKYKEFNLKKFAETNTSNQSWMYYLVSNYRDGDNFYDGYAERVNNLTSDYIRDMAAKMFGQGNVIRVVMKPAV